MNPMWGPTTQSRPPVRVAGQVLNEGCRGLDSLVNIEFRVYIVRK